MCRNLGRQCTQSCTRHARVGIELAISRRSSAAVQCAIAAKPSELMHAQSLQMQRRYDIANRQPRGLACERAMFSSAKRPSTALLEPRAPPCCCERFSNATSASSTGARARKGERKERGRSEPTNEARINNAANEPSRSVGRAPLLGRPAVIYTSRPGRPQSIKFGRVVCQTAPGKRTRCWYSTRPPRAGCPAVRGRCVCNAARGAHELRLTPYLISPFFFCYLAANQHVVIKMRSL